MYRAEIILIEPPGPEDNGGMPAIDLPEKHPTKAGAETAARDAIHLLQRPVGTATYRIFDGQGEAC